jgi:hypothetical protein
MASPLVGLMDLTELEVRDKDETTMQETVEKEAVKLVRRWRVTGALVPEKVHVAMFAVMYQGPYGSVSPLPSLQCHPLRARA